MQVRESGPTKSGADVVSGSKAAQVRRQISFLPRQRIAVHRPALDHRVRIATARTENNHVVLLVEVGLLRDVLRADVIVRDAHLIESESPPSFILRAQPRVHDRNPRNLDRMGLHCGRGGDGQSGNAQLGRGAINFIRRGVANNERPTIEFSSLGFERLFR